MHVEHEEVLLVPRWIDCRKATFKYALGSEFIETLKMLHALGLDSKEKVRVKGVEVSPRDVVAAVTPDPATIGDRMVGRAIVGTLVTGTRDGRAREVYFYQTSDARETMRQHGLQVVGYQTGFNPVVAMELLAEGAWKGEGVLGPEAFDPDPYLAVMDRYGIHHAIEERDPTDPPADRRAGGVALLTRRARSARSGGGRARDPAPRPPAVAAGPVAPSRSALRRTPVIPIAVPPSGPGRMAPASPCPSLTPAERLPRENKQEVAGDPGPAGATRGRETRPRVPR